jgi:3-oxoacyl-[acyl-carrier protein] reductase
MDYGFSDRVVIVTGGSRGIGRAAALAFARERARVLITFHSDPTRADAVVDQLRSAGAEAAAARFDLGAPDRLSGAAAAALERWGRIDVLVNNAVQWGTGESWGKPFESLDRTSWMPLVEANFGGYYAAIQAVLPATS